MRPRSLRIQTMVSNRSFTLSPAAWRICRRSNPSRARDRAVSLALAPATHQACSGAIRRAQAARPARASAAALPAAAARRAFPRRLRWLPGLDRRVLLRIDGHFVRFPEFRSVLRVNGADRAMFRRAGGLRTFSRAATACCCGSCRPRRSRARACRRCSRPATRCVDRCSITIARGHSALRGVFEEAGQHPVLETLDVDLQRIDRSTRGVIENASQPQRRHPDGAARRRCPTRCGWRRDCRRRSRSGIRHRRVRRPRPPA